MKKTTAILLLSFLFALTTGAQNPSTLDGWAQRLQLFGEKIQQEELFLHMDNSCYYLGDTLYFKAYMRLSDGRPSPLSRLLYVELLNQDGYLVSRQKVEMTGGQGTGSFALLDTLYGGYYELRAYTRWQLNWGLYDHPHTKNAEKWFYSKKMAQAYYRDYDKLYSRVFPVYDKPREPGDYAQDMTTRPLRRVFKQTKEKPKAVVTFYPEGGNWVNGTRQRIAFEANDEMGKHLKGTLRVQGETFSAEAETKSRGRGTMLVDGQTDHLTATFEWEGNKQKVELPKPVTDGVALTANLTAEGIHIDLQARGAAATEELGLTASCHGLLKDFQSLGAGTSLTADIPLAKLPTGVIQLTVYNAQGRIYADRLVFVRQPDFQPQNINFEGLNTNGYEPYSPVDIDIATSGSAQASVSVAVRDAAHSDYTFDGGNIMTEMLLASQIRGFVEQPEYFFEADDEEHRTALDLLLMVQGWRRYDWVEMATPNAFTLLHPYERTEWIYGEVNRYFAEEQEDLFAKASREFMQAEEERMDKLREEENEDESANSQTTTAEETLDGMFSDMNDRFAADQERFGFRTNGEQADNRFFEKYKEGGTLKKEAIVHAEFMQPWATKDAAVVGEMDTYNLGAFKIEAPKFYEACYFSVAAASKKNYKGDNHVWVEVNEDKNGRVNYPEFYVKLNPIFPRFVKPYTFYQQNLPTRRMQAGRRLHVDDEGIVMDEITVGARRGGMRHFDVTKPAFVIDAYDAFNDVCDAGFCPGYFIGGRRFISDVARTYIGDMNMERAYSLEMRYDSKNTTSLLSEYVMEKYNHLPRLDMVYIYTDYSPRMEGDKRFTQANQPMVTVDLRLMPNSGQRMTWRDRRTTLTGFSVCDDFYQPDYSQQHPQSPTDYRRTLYWNPNVQLDANGRAKLHFFTGSRKTQLTISAEGMTKDGAPLTGIQYSE